MSLHGAHQETLRPPRLTPPEDLPCLAATSFPAPHAALGLAFLPTPPGGGKP